MVHFTEALRTNPDDAEVHYNMGFSLASQRRFQEAIGHFAKACQIEPENVRAHFSLGLAYVEAGNQTAARGEYEILKRLDPGFAKALLKRVRTN